MSEIIGKGYTIDTSSRKITFEETECRNCEGTGKSNHGIWCANYGKNQRGKSCEYCGSKNKHSHKIVKWQKITCHTCNGTGREMQGLFSSLDFSQLIPGDFFKYEIFTGNQTINDAYLGIGNLCGLTGYTDGKYSTVEQCKPRIEESLQYTQAGNLFSADGIAPDTIYIKSSLQGSSYTAFVVGTRFGR